jgi:hypothetical protein
LLIVSAAALAAACAPVTSPFNGNPPHAGSDMASGSDGGDDGGITPGGDMASVQACLVTCASLGASCGIQGDGCGGQIDCGSCTAPATCGGAGKLNACGNASSGGPGGACVPTTCAALGFDCGPAGDGCGNALDCWPAGTTSCPNPGDICGGGGAPGVCGGGVGSSGGCTGPLCPASCPTGQTTTIEGYVYAPTPPAFGSPDPLPHALVYIPTKALDALPAGASCTQCTPASGDPVAYTTSDDTGHFVLTGTPAGAANTIPLVVQLGKWRREVNLSVAVTACMDNKLTNIDDTRLPRKQGDGLVSDIPKIAVVTGAYDSIECTLQKMGIDTTEFTNPTGSGRVNLFDNPTNGGGSYVDSSTPDQETLLASPSKLASYDMVVLDCVGTDQNEAKSSDYQNVADYINKSGGRVFASHYTYTYLQSQFSTVASWLGDPNSSYSKTNVTSTIAQASTAGTSGYDLATWLDYVDKSAYSFGTFIANEVKDNLGAVNSSLVRSWITYAYSKTVTNTMEVTFDAPVGSPASMQCGRVVYADFHVNSQDVENSGTFSSFCAAADPGVMTNQEKVLEYMLFDLSSCINPPPPPPPPTCVPTTCAALGYGCGPAGDGCGNPLDCGPCQNPGDSCGGGGTPFQCGQTQTCVPTTCAALGYNCGPAGDGCGGVLDCGACVSPERCGGGGQAGVCGGIG